jgi:hypothetical protein
MYKGRILLHAQKVTLPHPATGKTIIIEAPVPADMKKFKGLFSNAKIKTVKKLKK